jgi:hypothetical protein
MQLRRLSLRDNPLRRRSDRLETWLLWCAVVGALLMIPIGAATGNAVRAALDDSSARERAGLRQVEARTLESAEHEVPSAPGDVLTVLKVEYVDPHGQARQGFAPVVRGTRAGAEITIWLDRDGTVVPTPRSASDNVAFGASAGFGTVVGSWLLLWGLFRLARIPIDRRRMRAWDAEWATVAPRWYRGQK